MIRLGIIGCGDVAFRTYLPALQDMAAAGHATLVAAVDPVSERAADLAQRFPGAAAYTRYDDFLAHTGIDGVFNLTPAPAHRQTTGQALDAGFHVFTEKPIAATVADARALIAHAEGRGKVLMSAPAVMATRRFRWLKELIDSGRIGRLTLATAQMANMGPAGWRQYTGDPAVFYREGVGPVLDIGVYSLHAITGLFGPATRVQAMGGIAIPRRTATIPRIAGQTIAVTAPDVMSVQLEFGGRAWAQVLASFAVPRSKVPALEIHGTKGTVSIAADLWYNAEGPVDLFPRDETPLGVEGWLQGIASPEATGDGTHLIGAGPAHFVAVLRGEEAPILTAAHACHVLEIMLAAERSRVEGRAIELETSFAAVSHKPQAVSDKP